jgi:site-specific DNA-methyltransferase (adenine-specific)
MQPDWQTEDGSIQLYRGDCLKILPTIEAGSVDAVVTDPPYGKKTHAGARSMSKGGSRRGHNRIDFASTTAGMIRSSLGMIQPRRWCVSFIDWRHALSLEQEPPKGLEFVRLGIWSKLNPMPQLTGDRPATGWEAVAIFHAPGKKRWNGKGGPAMWFHGTSRFGYFGPSNHPTEKPLGLIEKILGQFTDEGEMIADPFMGSGTTAVACLNTGRKFIGIELDKKYFDIAVNRIEKAIAARSEMLVSV